MKTRVSGFTLIELIVAVAILGILLAVVAPSFTNTIKQNRVQSQLREVTAALAQARTAAVTRTRPVTVCRSNDGATCSGSWNNGWIVFIDRGTAGQFDSGTDELLSSGTVQQSVRLKVYSYADSSTTTQVTENYVQFSNRGVINKRFNFVVCDASNQLKFARAAFAGEVGRLLLSKAASLNATHRDINNQALTCP